MDITPFSDGELSSIEGFTPKLDLKAAKAEMLAWLPYSGRNEQDLDSFLKAVETDYMEFDDPYRGRPDGYSVNWKEPGWKEKGGGPQCTVWFRKTASQANPLRLHFKVSWSLNRPSKDRKGYDIPIPPPSGYEQVSMQAPANFGPDSAVDILEARGVDVGRSINEKSGGRVSANASVSSKDSQAAKIAGPDAKDDRSPWGIAILLALTTIALSAVAAKRRPS